MSNKIVEYKDLIAFHPGQYVEELIEDYNVTQKEFAERLGVSAKTVSKLVNAEESISKETAHKLAKLSGVSMQTWLNLQNAYDVKVAEIVEQKELEEGREKEICEMIDFKYFKNHGFVEEGRYTVVEKVKELRRILEVSSLEYLLNFNHLVSYRNTKDFTEKSIVNSNIMLELAAKQAREETSTKLDRKRLERYLPALRELTRLSPDLFYPKLKRDIVRLWCCLSRSTCFAKCQSKWCHEKIWRWQCFAFTDGSKQSIRYFLVLTFP